MEKVARVFVPCPVRLQVIPCLPDPLAFVRTTDGWCPGTLAGCLASSPGLGLGPGRSFHAAVAAAAAAGDGRPLETKRDLYFRDSSFREELSRED